MGSPFNAIRSPMECGNALRLYEQPRNSVVPLRKLWLLRADFDKGMSLLINSLLKLRHDYYHLYQQEASGFQFENNQFQKHAPDERGFDHNKLT